MENQHSCKIHIISVLRGPANEPITYMELMISYSFLLQSSPTPRAEPAKTEPEASASDAKIDPVMAKYMQMVAEQKQKEKDVRWF